MSSLHQFSTRSATSEDLSKLANLIHFEAYVHRHLDYRLPLDWVGYEPFIILEDRGSIEAALACPPDPPSVVWIRLFAVSTHISPNHAWNILWEKALEKLSSDGQIKYISAIPIYSWFTALLKNSHFRETHSIVMLSRETTPLPETPTTQDVNIRPMTFDDLETVQTIDAASFSPVWVNSRYYLESAFQQAAIATVAEYLGKIAGFQISTATPIGGHLARLAVLPELQGKGIGSALTYDLIYQFHRRGSQTITVNTQRNNPASLAVYHRMGFKLTGEEYPIFQLLDFP